MEQHIDDISTRPLDWSGTSADYARHRAGFPRALYDRLDAHGVLRAGARALDLGTGTGTIAIALADRGLAVTAVDIAEGQLEAARRLAGARPITFVRASAEHTGLRDEGFELVTAGQCWHWLDRAAAAREVARVLAPGGAVVIAHLDWLDRPGSLVAETLALVDAHRTVAPLGHEALAVRGLYPYWLEDLHDAGLVAIESFSFDVALPYGRESWRGRMRASAYVGAAMDAAGVARFDRALASLLERYPETFDVPHRVFVALARKEPL